MKLMDNYGDNILEVFIENLKKQPMMVEEWEETLWSMVIEKAVVHRDAKITFVFYNKSEIIEEA